MDIVNKEFNVPFYIFEEITQYLELTAQGHCKCMKWGNIKSLLKLTQLNDRLTDTQVKHIINTYCREPKRNDIID